MEASEITEIARSGPLLLAMLKRLANASHRAIASQSEGAVRGHALERAIATRFPDPYPPTLRDPQDGQSQRSAKVGLQCMMSFAHATRADPQGFCLRPMRSAPKERTRVFRPYLLTHPRGGT
jgi:hypothetical protein